MMPRAKTIEAKLRYDPPSLLYKLQFQAMGTNCYIAFAASSDQAAAQFARDAAQWVADFETKYSRFIPESIVSRINRLAGKAAVAIDAETSRILDICENIYHATKGLLDPTATPLLLLWNFRAAQPRIPSQNEIDNTLNLVGWPLLERDEHSVFLPLKGMALDFGGFGKEFAVDQVAEMALDHEIESALVEFGGDIRSLAPPPQLDRWSIGLETAAPESASVDTLLLAHRSVATSGNYRRNLVIEGRIYGHIVHPRNGKPYSTSPHIATILADSCLQAGILATTACMLPIGEAIAEVENACNAEGRILYEQKTASTLGFHEYILQHS